MAEIRDSSEIIQVEQNTDSYTVLRDTSSFVQVEWNTNSYTPMYCSSLFLQVEWSEDIPIATTRRRFAIII